MSGRLSKLARSWRRSENESLGALMNVYRLTQRAGVSQEMPARLITIIVIAFDSDGDADAFLNAMIQAKLASVLGDGSVRIHGNQERITEQDLWRQSQQIRSVRGGKARVATCERDATGQFKKPNVYPAGIQPASSQEPATTSRLSLKSSVLGSDLHSHTRERSISEDVPAGVLSGVSAGARPRKTKMLEPLVLAEFREIATKLGRPCPVNWSNFDHALAGAICGKYPTYRPVLEKYLSAQFYERWGWSIKYLADNADAVAGRQEPKDEVYDESKLPW